jgi:hypothetical protein
MKKLDDYEKGKLGHGNDKGILGERKPKTGGFMGKHHAVKNESLGSPFEGKGTKGTTRMEGKHK